MELADCHQWWKHQGGQELRRLLMQEWDPIGVKDAPEAADEYDGYRSPLMQLLRDGAAAERIADYLTTAERGMGLTPAEPPLGVAESLRRWYPDSLLRWEAPHSPD